MPLTEMTYTVADRVATITLDRPRRMNAWTPTMERELREAFAAATGDEGVRAIVLTGAGRAFCAGADIERLGAARDGGPAIAPAPTGTGDFDRRHSWLLAVDKPVLAAINGATAGVGLCLALHCDLRYMAAGARLSTAFARRGLIAEHGSAWLLPRLIGPMNAADLLLSGRTLDAHEAAAMGLVRELPAEGFLDAVRARAIELAALSSPRSMAIIKRQLRAQYTETLGAAIAFADAQTASCFATEDFREGVASLVERRPPSFTGG